MRLVSKSFCALPLFIAFVSVAFAHVTVWPRTSNPGAHEKYTVRVPTEGKVATTSIELVLPDEVTFVAVGAPGGHTYELKQLHGRVTSIVWSMKINPSEFAEFSFVARNPKAGKEIIWKAVQRFADGTTTQWVGSAGDKHPASVTKLTDSGTQHAH